MIKKILSLIISAAVSTVVGLIINRLSHANINIIILVAFFTILTLSIYYNFYWYSQTKKLASGSSKLEEKISKLETDINDINVKLTEEKKLNDDFAKEIRDLQSRISTLSATDESPLLKIKQVRDGYNFSSRITQD